MLELCAFLRFLFICRFLSFLNFIPVFKIVLPPANHYTCDNLSDYQIIKYWCTNILLNFLIRVLSRLIFCVKTSLFNMTIEYNIRTCYGCQKCIYCSYNLNEQGCECDKMVKPNKKIALKKFRMRLQENLRKIYTLV